MLKLWMANPWLKGYVTKLGSLGFVLIGVAQMSAPHLGVTLPPEIATGFDPITNILIGLISFGMARKVQRLIQAMEASGINVPDNIERIVNDAVAQEDRETERIASKAVARGLSTNTPPAPPAQPGGSV